MVFNWSLIDSKSPQATRILLSILADLIIAVVRMVSIHPLISMSSSPCTNPLVTVPRAPITICITVTLIFHSFFFSSLVGFFISLFAFLLFYSVARRNIKFHYSVGLFLFTIWSGRLAEVRWSFCIWKKKNWPSHFLRRILVCVRMIKFKLAQIPVDHLLQPVVSSLKLNLRQIIIIIIIITSLFANFRTSVSLWSFTGVWETAISSGFPESFESPVIFLSVRSLF